MWNYVLYILYIHTWYFQYMKKYQRDLLYFKGCRGQTLVVFWVHDKLKIYRIKNQTQWCNFANIYSYGHQEWYSIEENISRIIWSHQGTGSKEMDFFYFSFAFDNGLLGVIISHIQCKLSHEKIKCQKSF